MRDYIIKVTFEEDAFGNSIQDNCRQGCSWKGGGQGRSCNKNADVR